MRSTCHLVAVAFGAVLTLLGEGVAPPDSSVVTHIVLGLPDGAYRVVSGDDSLEVQSVEWSLRFGSRVVSPTEIKRVDD